VFDDRVMALVWALFSLHIPIAEYIYEILQYDDKGRPLKIKKSYYDDDLDLYTTNRYKSNWSEEDFVPSFIGIKSSDGNVNNEMEDMISDGWTRLG
jgi:hypothetical protein